jgi:hypothetical protein
LPCLREGDALCYVLKQHSIDAVAVLGFELRQWHISHLQDKQFSISQCSSQSTGLQEEGKGKQATPAWATS